MLAWHPAREPDVENQVPPPDVKPPFALIAAQPSAPAPPYTRVACSPSTSASHPAPTLPGRDHFRDPSTREHMRTLEAPLTVGAHVLGLDRRLPGYQETTFGAISTCVTVSSQRYHARAVLLPCAVAISCLSDVVFSLCRCVASMVARVCCSSVLFLHSNTPRHQYPSPCCSSVRELHSTHGYPL